MAFASCNLRVGLVLSQRRSLTVLHVTRAGSQPPAPLVQLDSGSFSLARDSSSASTSGRGKPVRVHAHRKLVKELTDLLLTQELMAHEGAHFDCTQSQPCM